MKKLAIIPARGGSKRLPKKNVKLFLGKPIVSYSIEAAIASGLFDEVMVSTDDPEIASIAASYGAKVPFLRSAVNSGDHATTFDVIKEVMTYYQGQGENFTYTCCIYPCAPFVDGAALSESFLKLVERDCDCIFPVVRYGHPIQRALRITPDDYVEMLYPGYMQTRSQDLAKSYHDLGQFYFFKTKAILEAGQLWTDKTGYLEIPESEAQDIDNLEDWKLAEIKYKLLNSR